MLARATFCGLSPTRWPVALGILIGVETYVTGRNTAPTRPIMQQTGCSSQNLQSYATIACVNRYGSGRRMQGDSWHHTRITLKPANPDFEPIVLTSNKGQLKVVSELVEVLGGHESHGWNRQSMSYPLKHISIRIRRGRTRGAGRPGICATRAGER